ncbi:MAG: hypothetical protein M3Y72_15305 [Acidobacteriota bacterium]|nr:hypothetical protein [Acidobacteriota bacterium]
MKKQALWILALAMAVRLAIAYFQNAPHDLARAEMELAAISLAQHGVLGNVYAFPTGASAHVAPGYAVILAAIFYLFGTSVIGETVKILVTCIISSTQYALLPWFGKMLKLPKALGLSAGIIGALLPLNPYIEIQGDFENHLTALLLLLLLVWMEVFSDRAWNLREAVLSGLFLGVCALTSPVLLPCSLLAVVVIFASQVVIPAGRPRAMAACALTAALVVSPWVVRNYLQLGSPILTRSTFGLEFHLANNPLASPLMTENARVFACCHPYFNVEEAKKVGQQGEVAYNRRLLHETVGWIRTNPKKFVQLVVEHVWFTWFPDAPQRLREIVLRMMTLLSWLGFLAIWRIRPKSALLLGFPLLVYPLPFYLLQVHLRYRYPINFVILLTAMAGSAALYRAFRFGMQDRYRQSFCGLGQWEPVRVEMPFLPYKPGERVTIERSPSSP